MDKILLCVAINLVKTVETGLRFIEKKKTTGKKQGVLIKKHNKANR